MSPFRNPLPAVDLIIRIEDEIVLIERKNEPRGLALPGGFVEEGELLEEAAIREAKEETGLVVDLKELLYVYSRPDRDPRRHTLSVVYIAEARGMPEGGDDARRAFLCDPNELPADFVFDHGEILRDYLRFIDTGRRPTPGEMMERFRQSRGKSGEIP